MTDPVLALAELFLTQGSAEYLGEPVTQAAHMLQTAAWADSADAAEPLVAAALLHDVGHFVGALSGHDLMAGIDNRHGEVGAAWLAAWFPPAVTEPIRLHVAAKRFLFAIEPGYHARLSPASQHTLTVQGGPMSPAEAAAFATRPHAADAVALRRWDEQAKDPEAEVVPFASYLPLLRGLLNREARTRGAT